MSEMIVPPMAILYIAVAIFVVIKNFYLLPDVFTEIFKGAFGLDSAVGGGIGLCDEIWYSARVICERSRYG